MGSAARNHGAGALGADWAQIMAPRGPHSALVVVGRGPAAVPRGGLAFVAAPYIGQADLKGRWRIERSVRLGMYIAREMMRLRKRGVSAVCPVLMQAVMCEAADLVGDAADPMDAAGWAAWVWPMLTVAQCVVVPDIVGWQDCPQIKAQVAHALAHNLPVHIYAGAQ